MLTTAEGVVWDITLRLPRPLAQSATSQAAPELVRTPGRQQINAADKPHGKFTPGMSTTLTPLAMDAWLLTLRDLGTWTYEAVSEFAIRYAEQGFPVSEVLRDDIIEYAEGFAGWPANAEIFMPGGKIPNVGDMLKQLALARSLRKLVEVEREASASGRTAAIDAIREYFYRGEMGRSLVEFCQRHDGLLSMDDMRDAKAKIEAPVSYKFVEGGSKLKALASACAGFLLAMIGLDPVGGSNRFIFGQMDLLEGVDFVVVAMGLFAVAEVLITLEAANSGNPISVKLRSLWITWADWLASWKAILRGSFLGFGLGVLPGPGTIVTFASYALERNLSPTPEQFGKGAIAGVAGPESANNSETIARFVPLLSLGIPGSNVTAIFLSAMTCTA